MQLRVSWVAWLVVGAACADKAPDGRGEAWPEANDLFHREARFIGADGAYSVDIGGERTLWLFGDTFVARDRVDPHRTAAFLRNSVALQTGRDPRTAWIRHYWAHDGDDVVSFFAEPDAATWLWPAHGIRLDDVLVLFFERLLNESAPGPWSFAGDGWDARVVENPDAEPDQWRVRPALLPADGGAGGTIGEAVARHDGHVLAFATRGDDHAVWLARFAEADARAGDLSHPERYCGGGRWAEDCRGATLFSPGAPEFSAHFDAARERWVWVASGGFGAAPIVWRTAPAPEGPWSDPTTVFRPPEASRDGAFVYAAKAHPELDGQGALVATYVPAGLDDFPASLDGIYYFPFFARLWLD